ncbi:hypothetical protein A3H80_04665 [Candidatus Roizmanbacteria bacterium RIFCSPLOWO2_02_FULL_37_19]|uniref:Type II secretion system protein GspG C-terminal domain-containing protein n=1 Tax=Candidatus Roizmanbacteria bacterium RIFCSPHIGHO2_02_FULL_37_24 TaxID=1802037 RepID=A0A1F7GZ12_9BACT|nr:MAG: hypothetical protein A2862_00105 [Candidatus Roizmanbacteria bacterium RIFCSPHIGHO2_01_FULL_38_41]OGK23994.1 MAG: hypothetical protein A3C24_02800 [Candidatus Roizmanbacteria bacterium RIFCSPHIGHO2_02_FULL_37_24]OGK32392.1 MAG: hypothetical protein A3E10_04390 [Candidatus Roizmanbacteria bacterium RIFCSPHIGHO2_12_FULL_37_23]OGK44248.1 MAG: hypothetical protein A2956_00165 [Candidatus Roizmanbacteria bacterium RIFCSPLOWO2_01_FULL_37_57]OGK54151.1 MAG: hypothetical protein A3H80_04665 [Ca
MNKKNLNKGFTLIELLVVVAIIAILALLILLALNPVEMQRRSRDSERLSDLGTLRKAIDLTLADGGTLPGTTGTPFSRNTGAASLDVTDDVNNLVGMDIGKYLSVIPQDPQHEAGDATTIQTTNGVCPSGTASIQKQNMVYTFTSDGDVYVLTATLESTDNCKIPSEDGGDDDDLYELGTDPGLDL